MAIEKLKKKPLHIRKNMVSEMKKLRGEYVTSW